MVRSLIDPEGSWVQAPVRTDNLPVEYKSRDVSLHTLYGYVVFISSTLYPAIARLNHCAPLSVRFRDAAD